MFPITFDHSGLVERLYPFAETRNVLDIRVGIFTLREKWAWLLKDASTNAKSSVNLPSNLLPTPSLTNDILTGKFDYHKIDPTLKRIEYPWHIFQFNDVAIRDDFELLSRNRLSSVIPESVQVNRSTRIFIEEGATLSHCFLNAETGPIYIGRNAQIMEGAVIRGPVAVCEGSVVKMGAKIYGATTIGPYSVVGGEIKNSVIFGYSNKAHDGYLGDSVIGEWCNLGAGTSNSNMSNNAGEVSVWTPSSNGYVIVGNKCGLLMGDYSRSAINTSFNTGTVVGVSCNVFGEGLSPKHIPHFSWGMKPFTRYAFDKAMRDISNWKKLKNQTLSETEIQQLKIIFDRI